MSLCVDEHLQRVSTRTLWTSDSLKCGLSPRGSGSWASDSPWRRHEAKPGVVCKFDKIWKKVRVWIITALQWASATIIWVWIVWGSSRLHSGTCFVQSTCCLWAISWEHGNHFHSYVDDAQLYISLSPNDIRPKLVQCTDPINLWMSLHFLELNTERSRDFRSHFSNVTKNASYLRYIFYIFFYHLSPRVRACFYH